MTTNQKKNRNKFMPIVRHIMPDFNKRSFAGERYIYSLEAVKADRSKTLHVRT